MVLFFPLRPVSGVFGFFVGKCYGRIAVLFDMIIVSKKPWGQVVVKFATEEIFVRLVRTRKRTAVSKGWSSVGRASLGPYDYHLNLRLPDHFHRYRVATQSGFELRLELEKIGYG